MFKPRLLLGVGVLLLVGLAGSTVSQARPPGWTTCSGGAIAGGVYENLNVTGNCTFAGGAVTVNGDLSVLDGASLNDHAATYAPVYVKGDVLVGKRAVLGLGNYDPTPPHTSAIVGGSVIANQPLTLYLGGITIHGSLLSWGGGSGPAGPFRNFPTKDDTIWGNLSIQHWNGGWLGVIRVNVHGNATVSYNNSVVTDDGSPPPDSDSTEVMTNVIGGTLMCRGNSPAAQVNPLDGGQPNIVGGEKLSQCAGL